MCVECTGRPLESLPLGEGATTATNTGGGENGATPCASGLVQRGGVLRETGWCARAAGSSGGASVCWGWCIGRTLKVLSSTPHGNSSHN